MKDLESANKYLKSKKKEKNEFRPLFHLSPSFGWINDPHGIVYFKGIYHIFFQYNPYATKAENIFWGHVTTEDFIYFSKTTCAIAPDMPYDSNGCWSGSAIVLNGILYLVYTGFSLHEDGRYYQTICVAESKDGYNFTKTSLNPIIDSEDIPSFASVFDFRDPHVFKRGGKLYLLIGSRTRDEKEAMLLLFEGDDIYHFHYLKTLIRSDRLGTMFECPNILSFESNDYVIVSPPELKERDGDFANTSSCVYFRLPKDFISRDVDITVDDFHEIDHGFEFYAPTVYDDGKILVNWFQMWLRRYYLSEIGNDFASSFSMFKRVEEHDGILSFHPIFNEELVSTKTERNISIKDRQVLSTLPTAHYVVDFDIKENQVSSLIFAGTTLFTIDASQDKYILDRTKTNIPLFGAEHTGSEKGLRYLRKKIPQHVSLDIYVDNGCIEIYLDDHKESFSFICFDTSMSLSFESDRLTEIHIIEEKVGGKRE